MNCVNCQERLSQSDSSGIQTYICLNCDGVWVNSKAIDFLLTQEKSRQNSKSLIDGCGAHKSKERVCVACHEQPLNAIDTQGVEIDACPKCYGVFFDKGEIQKILPTSHVPQKGIAGAIAKESLLWVIMAIIS